ncbi:FeoA family protein [Anaerotignum sp.]|uniref:FeoA family protein n=1 Tax=Anaerotignum sp. TaxID=2039241 RepID=UPI003317CB79
MKTSLDFLKIGEEGRVVELKCRKEIYRRLLEMGVTPNTVIHCIRWAPRRGAIEIRIRGFSLALGYSEATSIVIEKGGELCE